MKAWTCAHNRAKVKILLWMWGLSKKPPGGGCFGRFNTIWHHCLGNKVPHCLQKGIWCPVCSFAQPSIIFVLKKLKSCTLFIYLQLFFSERDCWQSPGGAALEHSDPTPPFGGYMNTTQTGAKGKHAGCRFLKRRKLRIFLIFSHVFWPCKWLTPKDSLITPSSFFISCRSWILKAKLTHPQ